MDQTFVNHRHAAGFAAEECSPCQEPIEPGVTHVYESYPRYETDPHDEDDHFDEPTEAMQRLFEERDRKQRELGSQRERTADGMLKVSNEAVARDVRRSTRDTDAIAAKIASSRYIFVCPPEWEMTPHQLVALCRAAHPFWANIAAGGMGLGGGLSAFLAGDAEATVGAGYEGWAISAAVLFGAAGWAKATSWALRHRALRKLARLDLSRVIEVRNANSVLRAMAECKDVDALSAYLAQPAAEALRELWDDAIEANAKPIDTAPKPKNWADAAVQSMGQMTVEATDRVAALEGAPPAPPSRWQIAREHFEAVELAWEKIICDPVAAIEHSALLDDVTQPRSAAFHQAFSKAKYTLNRLLIEHPDGGTTEPGLVDVETFEDQARAAATAWKGAKDWSEHIGYGWLPEEERGTVQTIRNCLALAADENAGIGERINAAETATKLLKRVRSFVMPKAAIQAIEAKVRALPAGSSLTDQPILREPETEHHEA